MVNRKKNVSISFRTTEAESEVIHALAEESGLSLSEYLTACAMGKEIIKMPDITELTKELKRQGNNLNRLLVLAQTGRIETVYLNETMNAYWKIQKRFKEFFDERRKK